MTLVIDPQTRTPPHGDPLRPKPERESVIAECDTCSMPVRVIFEGSRIVAVYAVCGHVKEPDA